MKKRVHRSVQRVLALGGVPSSLLIAIAATSCASSAVPAPAEPAPAEATPEAPAAPASTGPSSTIVRPDAARAEECVDPGDSDVSGEFEQAATIESQARIVGCTKRGDVDAFRFKLPASVGGQLSTVSVSGKSRMSPRLELFDANRKRIAVLSGGPGEQLVAWAHAAGGSEVFVKVGQVHSAEETYTLEVKTAPLPDTSEPNDSADEAKKIPKSGEITGFVGRPANDSAAVEDWYVFEATKDGKLKVALQPTEDVSPILALYDATRRRLQNKMGEDGQFVEVEAAGKKGSSYFVEVRPVHEPHAAGAGQPPARLLQPYKLVVTQ